MRLLFHKMVFAFAIVLITTAFAFSAGPLPAQDFASQNEPALAAELLAQVNAWRVSESVPPLRVNATLEEMAIEQAAYVRGRMAAGQRVDNFHLDARGLDPQQRAYSLYGWQTYGDSAQIEISENAAVGNVRYAINYWRNSEIHRRAALSLTYREVGVAAIPTASGDRVFIIVFGARPGVLPVMADPGGTALYISREYSRYSSARTIEPIVRLFNANGQAVTPSQPWRYAVPIPANAGDRLLVLITAGDSQTIAQVDLKQDLAALPAGSAPVLAPTAFPATATLAPARATAIPSATATNTLRPGVTPTNTLVPTATLTPSRTPTFTPTLPPTVAPTDMPDPDLIITYDRDSLVVRAVSTRRPNLTTMRLINGVGNIAVTRWLQIATFPAESFPQNQCLVLYRAGTSVPQPSGCAFVRSAIQVSGDRVFWMAGTFDVQFNDQVNRTCPQGPGQCLVKVGG
ncbi:MAG: CAP domain-containing protein [Chloroflexi bacterium]|nr:CAP domain-containing protein [Chloroflexota bacterium]